MRVLAERTRAHAAMVATAGFTLLLAAACGAEPYRLRLYVADDARCEPYEAALFDAIDFWGEFGVDAFAFDGCVVDDFRARPMVRAPPEARGYTTDLAQFSDHVPVYGVDEILLDAGNYNVARPVSVGLPSHVVPCPGLVASTVAEPIPLAHELGHLLWLPHSDDPGNLMYDGQPNQRLGALKISSKQIDSANGAFEDCRKQTK